MSLDISLYMQILLVVLGARAAIYNAHNHGRLRDMSINEVGRLCSKANITITESNALNDRLGNAGLLSVM